MSPPMMATTVISEDVVVADVRHLVGDDALQFLAVHQLEQAPGHGDRGVLRVAAGGEGVGRVGVDDVDLGLGYARRDGDFLDDVVQLVELGRVGRAWRRSRPGRACPSCSRG